VDFFCLKLILIEFRVKKVLFGPFIDSESEGTRCELRSRRSGRAEKAVGSMEAASGANQLGLMFICWKKDETRRILREFSPCETLLFFRSVALRVLFSAASAAWPASSPYRRSE
jgi:hypothetical protein